MDSSKKNRGKKRDQRNRSNAEPIRNFRTLFPVMLTPEGIKGQVLKDLHYLLMTLSSSAKFVDSSHDCEREICHGAITVTFGDVCELSNVLFKELQERFGRVYSTLSDLTKNSSHSSLRDSVEEIALLLRCCMSLLTLLEEQQNHVLEKGLILLKILKMLSFQNLVRNRGRRALFFEKSVFHESGPFDNGCTTSSAEDFTASLQFLEPHNPLLFFMLAVLEVYVDELLLNKKLGGYFMMINSVASINERLPIPCFSQCDIGILMEALSNHFILSFSDKEVFEDFPTRLFWLRTSELRYPFISSGIGMTAARSLLHSPVTISAPKYMQAHLVSLVSETTDMMVNLKNLKPDHKLLVSFLSIFERSVTLYRAHISCLLWIDSSTSAKGSASFNTPPHLLFEQYISLETRNKIDSLVTEVDHSLNPDIDNFSGMKSDLVSSSMKFLKECQNIYGISCQDEIFGIMSCLIFKASESCESFGDNKIQAIDGTALQLIYLLASLLKLMSISLIQALWCLRHTDDFCSLKTLKDFSSCKEYDFILQTIRFFENLGCSSPLQQVLCNAMLSHSKKHMHSKMMFLHFSGLMSVGFVKGLGCLVKGCLLINHALLNLFVFEEGNLDMLQSLADSRKESLSSSLPLVKFHETIVGWNSSLVVASKFQKIRSLHPRVLGKRCKAIGISSSQSSASTLDAVPVADPEEETEETCNGEVFLNCMLKEGEKVPDFNDLASFVECREGKDYAAWLRNRQKYNRKKYEKLAILRWKRKTRTWRSVVGKRN